MKNNTEREREKGNKARKNNAVGEIYTYKSPSISKGKAAVKSSINTEARKLKRNVRLAMKTEEGEKPEGEGHLLRKINRVYEKEREDKDKYKSATCYKFWNTIH